MLHEVAPNEAERQVISRNLQTLNLSDNIVTAILSAENFTAIADQLQANGMGGYEELRQMTDSSKGFATPAELPARIKTMQATGDHQEPSVLCLADFGTLSALPETAASCRQAGIPLVTGMQCRIEVTHRRPSAVNSSRMSLQPADFSVEISRLGFHISRQPESVVSLGAADQGAAWLHIPAAPVHRAANRTP